MADDDDTPITVSRAELRKLIADEKRQADMPDDERRVRSMIREEVAAAFGEMFEPADEDDGTREPKERKPKNKPKEAGLLGDLFGSGN